MDKFTLGYLWFLSVMLALLLGNEIALMETDRLIATSQDQVRKCHEVITGGIYK